MPGNSAQEISQIPRRVRELREVEEISVLDMARDVGAAPEVYAGYESGEKDIPISVLYKIAAALGVDPTVILTGEDPRMESAAVCRAGAGVEIERYPGYEFSSMAYNFRGRTMEPLLVYLDPSRPEAPQVSHGGQEFNYVTEGKVKVTVGNRAYVLSPGDSIYFNAALPHGQAAV
ncbi:MAG: cupin domain-containing protein, partial [Treponema sp.]|nr:cupin domain-containing protein [Treponema sp.]